MSIEALNSIRTISTTQTLNSSSETRASLNAGVSAVEAVPGEISVGTSDIGDKVDISHEAKVLADTDSNATENNETSKSGDSKEAENSAPEQKDSDELEEGELTEEEKQQIQELKNRDREVREHESAHLRVAGSLARGGAKFEYQSGPDGKRYAVGGHVNIDVSKEKEPEQTISKAQKIKQAALAPAEPSSKDRQVASKADGLIFEARKEIQEEALEGNSEETTGTQSPETNNTDETRPANEEQSNPFESDTNAPSKFEGFSNDAPKFSFEPFGKGTDLSQQNPFSNSEDSNQRNASSFGVPSYNKQGQSSGSLISGGVSLIA